MGLADIRWMAVGLAALPMWTCTALIDVDPDCSDAACAPYLCAADGIACVATCESDAECALGWGCDASTATCERTACGADTSVQRIKLELPAVVLDIDFAFVSPAEVPSQFIVGVGNPLGFGVRRFARNGAPAPDALGPNGLIELVGSNPSRRRFFPSLLAGRAPLGASQDRIVMALVDASRPEQTSRDRLLFANFTVAPLAPPFRAEIGSSALQSEFADATIVPFEEGYAVAWRENPTDGARARLMRIASDGAPAWAIGDPAARDVVVSDRDERVDAVAVSAAGEYLLVFYQAVRQSERRVRMAVLDRDGTLVGRALVAGRIEPLQTISHFSAASVGGAAVLTWRVNAPPGAAATADARYAVVSTSLAAEVAGGRNNVEAAVTPLRDTFSTVNEVTAAANLSEFVIGVRGVRNGVESQWGLRVPAAGEPRLQPFQIAANNIGLADSLRLSSTSDGWAALWVEGRDSSIASVYYSLFRCEAE